MKNKVMSYGLGKALITIKMSDLPKDIQEGLIKLHSNRTDKYRITENTEVVVFCGDVTTR